MWVVAKIKALEINIFKRKLVEKLGNAFHIDGDDLRGLSSNADYSEQGRINNIRTAQSIAIYLDNKEYDVVVSVVAPYKWLREEFKERHKVNEIYLLSLIHI